MSCTLAARKHSQVIASCDDPMRRVLPCITVRVMMTSHHNPTRRCGAIETAHCLRRQSLDNGAALTLTAWTWMALPPAGRSLVACTILTAEVLPIASSRFVQQMHSLFLLLLPGAASQLTSCTAFIREPKYDASTGLTVRSGISFDCRATLKVLGSPQRSKCYDELLKLLLAFFP